MQSPVRNRLGRPWPMEYDGAPEQYRATEPPDCCYAWRRTTLRSAVETWCTTKGRDKLSVHILLQRRDGPVSVTVPCLLPLLVRELHSRFLYEHRA